MPSATNTEAMRAAGWQVLRQTEVTGPMYGYGDLAVQKDLPVQRRRVASALLPRWFRQPLARVGQEVACNEVERLALRAVAPRATAQRLPIRSARSARAERSQREHFHHAT